MRFPLSSRLVLRLCVEMALESSSYFIVRRGTLRISPYELAFLYLLRAREGREGVSVDCADVNTYTGVDVIYNKGCVRYGFVQTVVFIVGTSLGPQCHAIMQMRGISSSY